MRAPFLVDVSSAKPRKGQACPAGGRFVRSLRLEHGDPDDDYEDDDDLEDDDEDETVDEEDDEEEEETWQVAA